MIFLALLLAATTSAAVAMRNDGDLRTIARWGLGLALAATGLTHFVNPTPFEQHLPGWVPAAGVVVALSGIAEVALGAALLLRWPKKPLTGQIVAAFFVAIFPANVYVAVAGVEVDGQPGGPYPWVRLPFQLLFIAWALWSTSEPQSGQPPTRGLMPPLPWSTGHTTSLPPGTQTVVMASVLELRRYRDVPGFMFAALRLRSLFAHSRGAVRLSLTAIPLGKTFWTLSQWESQAHLDAYARHPQHIDVMETFSGRMAASTFATWNQTYPSKPRWEQAHAEIDRTRRASPVGRP